jgi:6-pyruvoyltetrahydropterin/6-carboxytetrahydropterin synthase
MDAHARARIVVQKDEHKFSCAHMTVFADGSKERLHGHNFHLAVAIELPADDHYPMLDFARVKAVLSDLCAELREHLLLPAHCPLVRVLHHDDHELEIYFCDRRYVFPSEDVLLLPVDNIVVERLAQYLWTRVREGLQTELRECGALELDVSVTESPGQGATWSAPLP